MDHRTIVEYGGSGSFHIGTLPEGCKRCIKGEKSVLYVTGSCGVKCYYCTIPEDRSDKNSVFINEIKIINPDIAYSLRNLVNEIDLCSSTGVGITGGDPLLQPKRVISYLRHMDTIYGNNFHTHLYTSGQYLNDTILRQLIDAGLDELRIHPKNIDNRTIIDKTISIKQQYPELSIGFEVPAIPNKHKEILMLINLADQNDIDFINFNEFEFTSTNYDHLSELKFKAFTTGAAVEGSAEMMHAIFEEIATNTSISLHFCSSASKDSIQLVQRFMRRANSIARPFESISDEGELEYGRLWANKEIMNKIVSYLTDEGEVPEELIHVDWDLGVIETSWLILETLIDEIRQTFGFLKAEIISKHPIKNGPITWVNPL